MRTSAAGNLRNRRHRRNEGVWPIPLIHGIRSRTRPMPHRFGKGTNSLCCGHGHGFRAKCCCVLSHHVSIKCLPNHWRYAAGHTAGFEPAKGRGASGIHVGITWCTAVKDRFKHRLEATLQEYFTNRGFRKHGKKAANRRKLPQSPQLFCFFRRSIIRLRNAGGSVTSTRGPKPRIRITISVSSSGSYRIRIR